jgi:hypothetical protein
LTPVEHKIGEEYWLTLGLVGLKDLTEM